MCTSAAVDEDEAWAMTVSEPPDAASLLLVGFIVSSALAESVKNHDVKSPSDVTLPHLRCRTPNLTLSPAKKISSLRTQKPSLAAAQND